MLIEMHACDHHCICTGADNKCIILVGGGGVPFFAEMGTSLRGTPCVHVACGEVTQVP